MQFDVKGSQVEAEGGWFEVKGWRWRRLRGVQFEVKGVEVKVKGV